MALADDAPSDFDDLCLGKPRGVVVFVDDWKGATAKPEDRVFYLARAFGLRPPSELRNLRELLQQAGAAEWHATDRKSLFTSTHYEAIFRALNDGTSRSLGSLRDRRELLAPHLEEEVAKVAHLADHWPAGSPYARGLLRFLCRMHESAAIDVFRHAAAGFQIGRPISVLVVTDRLDWIKDESAPILRLRMPDPPKEIAALVAFEVVTVADKEAPEAQPFLPLLGLIDSEAWLFARTQTARLSDGLTVRQRFQRWRDSKGSRDERVLVDGDEEPIRAHLGSANAWHFFESGFLAWIRDRHVILEDQ